MPQTLEKNVDFLVAALSQTFITALKLGEDGMYERVGFGRVEKYSGDLVRLRGIDGTVNHFERGAVRFQRR
ncbi:hypothetical protein F4V43_03350 [Paenibacillus spiritus]|uniref:Uncharacterized protein n=1 Tax=Paenibacillus spiritus TaxID=2496557 RepID=A0A5J5GHQ6_9BACL|nr:MULTISPECIES: hypothetical protein [Paenibacillus]KAA9007540.1 hypothetical protein F4V43_03350 [Paenibacillus spiritus]